MDLHALRPSVAARRISRQQKCELQAVQRCSIHPPHSNGFAVLINHDDRHFPSEPTSLCFCRVEDSLGSMGVQVP